MKKRVLCGILAAVLCMLCVGCGGDTQTSGKASDSEFVAMADQVVKEFNDNIYDKEQNSDSFFKFEKESDINGLKVVEYIGEEPASEGNGTVKTYCNVIYDKETKEFVGVQLGSQGTYSSMTYATKVLAQSSTFGLSETLTEEEMKQFQMQISSVNRGYAKDVEVPFGAYTCRFVGSEKDSSTDTDTPACEVWMIKTNYYNNFKTE